MSLIDSFASHAELTATLTIVRPILSKAERPVRRELVQRGSLEGHEARPPPLRLKAAGALLRAELRTSAISLRSHCNLTAMDLANRHNHPP